MIISATDLISDAAGSPIVSSPAQLSSMMRQSAYLCTLNLLSQVFALAFSGGLKLARLFRHIKSLVVGSRKRTESPLEAITVSGEGRPAMLQNILTCAGPRYMQSFFPIHAELLYYRPSSRDSGHQKYQFCNVILVFSSFFLLDLFGL
jgi:hypothetical protein